MLQGEDGEIVTWRVDTEEQNITAKARLSRHDRFSAGSFFSYFPNPKIRYVGPSIHQLKVNGFHLLNSTTFHFVIEMRDGVGNILLIKI